MAARDPSMIRILIADDHSQTRKQIRQLLENHDGWQVVAEGSDGHEAILHTKAHDPHIVLLDIQMPKMNGFEATRQILETFPRMLILIISFHDGTYFAQTPPPSKGIFGAGAPCKRAGRRHRVNFEWRFALSRQHGVARRKLNCFLVIT